MRMLHHVTLVVQVSKRSTLGIPNALQILIGSEEDGKGLKLCVGIVTLQHACHQRVTPLQMVQQLRVKERGVQRHHGQPPHHSALAMQRFEL